MRTTELATEDLDAARDLAEALRALMLAANRSGAEPAVLRSVVAQLEDLASALEPAVRPGAVRLELDAPIRARLDQEPLRTGDYSAFSVPLQVEFSPDGTVAQAALTADTLLEGPLAAMHGGIIAWVFDIVLGVLVHAQGQGAVTASLDVRYLQRTPLDSPLLVKARILSSAGRRTTVEGTISVAGAITARATGEFVVPRDL